MRFSLKVLSPSPCTVDNEEIGIYSSAEVFVVLTPKLKSLLSNIGIVLLLAGLYYAGGLLGRVFLLDGSKMSLFWPPAGIGFAALLMLGCRFWPGIWIGSFLLCLFSPYQVHPWTVKSIVAGCIPLASTFSLQCAIPAWLAKRWLGYTNERWDIVAFLKATLLINPVCTLIFSSLSILIAFSMNTLTPAEVLPMWIGRWIASNLAVIVIATFIISCYHQFRSRDIPLLQKPGKSLGYLFSGAIILMMLYATIWQWQVTLNQNKIKAHAHFEQLTNAAETRLRIRLLSYQDVLDGAKGFILGSESVMPEEWAAYAKALNLAERYPGILDLSYRPRGILSLDEEVPVNFAPKTDPSEPIDWSKRPWPNSVAALATADGQAHLTQPIEIKVNGKAEVGFLLLMPVYCPQVKIETVAQRINGVRGWVAAPVLAKPLFRGILDADDSPELTYSISDVNKPIYTSNEKLLSPNLYTKITYFHYAGRQWKITWHSTRYFAGDFNSYQSSLVLFLGLFLTLLLAILLLNLNTTRNRAILLAQDAIHESEARNVLLNETNAILAEELNERHRIEVLNEVISDRNALILNAIEDGIVGYDPHGNILFANPAAISMLGCTSLDDFLAKGDFHSTFHHTHNDGTHYPITDCPIQYGAKNGIAACSRGEKFFTLDGKEFFVEYTITPCFKVEHLMGAVLVFQNINEELIHERQLHEIKQRYEAVFNESHHFIGLLDPNGILLETNKNSLRTGDLSASDVIGKAFWDCPWWSHSEEIKTQLKNAVERAKQNEFITFEIQNQQPNGEWMYIAFSLKPITDIHGKVIQLIPEGHNITELKKIETEHRNMVTQLQEVARMRQMFVSTLTHDLRTPLIAQHRVLENLSKENAIKQDEKLTYLIKGFLQNNKDLMQMVNNLLETYQLEDGRIQLLPEPLNLYQLAEKCRMELEQVFEDHDLTLENKISPDIPIIEADSLLLKRVFQNLLGNALHNVPAGSHITLEAADWEDFIDVTVRDDGPGMHESMIPHLFTRYLSGLGPRKKIGSGLGLYICKMISELHGGTIRMDSPPNAGVAVSITLPKERPVF